MLQTGPKRSEYLGESLTHLGVEEHFRLVGSLSGFLRPLRCRRLSLSLSLGEATNIKDTSSSSRAGEAAVIGLGHRFIRNGGDGGLLSLSLPVSLSLSLLSVPLSKVTAIILTQKRGHCQSEREKRVLGDPMNGDNVVLLAIYDDDRRVIESVSMASPKSITSSRLGPDTVVP